MLNFAVAVVLFIYVPIILLFPCYPPMLNSQIYDCEAPGPSTLTDYAVVVLVGGFNTIVVWQNLLDALFHGGYIVFMGCVVLHEYILAIDNRFIQTSF